MTVYTKGGSSHERETDVALYFQRKEGRGVFSRRPLRHTLRANREGKKKGIPYVCTETGLTGTEVIRRQTDGTKGKFFFFSPANNHEKGEPMVRSLLREGEGLAGRLL